MNIFVYGTLKQGFGNHARFLNRKPNHVGYVQGKLYVAGLPYLRPGDSKVYGEVYDVPVDLVKTLDALEGHPKWYCRTPITVTTEGNFRVKAEAYVYQNAVDERFFIASGEYR